ncbi:MAG: tetratricopeptide repeat protein [Bryobacteraceae bacterium]
MATTLRRKVAFSLLLCVPLLAQSDHPLGFIASVPGAGKIQPAGTRTTLAAQPGIFLFPGDALSGPPGSIDFYYCPATPGAPKLHYTLRAPMTLGASPPQPAGEPIAVCSIPDLAREPDVATLPAINELLGPPSPPELLNDHINALPPETRARLESLRSAGLDSPRLRLAFAVALQDAGLKRDAADQYALVVEAWKDQPALHQLIRDLLIEDRVSSRAIVHPPDPAEATSTPQGKTYALVVGISAYEQPQVPNLDFAAEDAKAFDHYLHTPRGGADEVSLLTDAAATSGAIRNYFINLTTKAKKDDAVILLIAAHGDMIRDRPVVITHRSNPQDFSINSIPMSQIQRWMLGQQPFRRAYVFLDVCHAGHVAQFATPDGSAASPREYLMLLATHQGRDAFAYESKIFSPGHGAFTYFLLRALNTPEARNPSGNFVSAANLTQYVLTNVMNATGGRQVPTPAIGVDLDTPIADLNKAGFAFDQTPLASLRLDPATLKKTPGKRSLTEKAALPTPSRQSAGADLTRRIALEDRGEEILLRYLQGDEVPQNEADFRACADIYAEALRLQPGSPYLEARRSFCEGRAAIFAKPPYVNAITSLERAIRLEPGAAYGYNALGIAYLQQSQFAPAMSALEDAIQRAPKWAYARHNLALARMQTGDYAGAEADLRAAMDLAPGYFYLPYGLGLLYQRMNRLDEARASYRHSATLAPRRAEPLNGLGSLDMLQGKWKSAESSFKAALALPDQLPLAAKSARHNLGIVLARKRDTRSEALDFWKQNGDYAPSKVSLADASWQAVNQGRPGNQEAIRQALAAHEEAIKLSPRPDVTTLERIGVLYLMNEQWDHACQSLDSALAISPDAKTRRRLESARTRCATHIK